MDCEILYYKGVVISKDNSYAILPLVYIIHTF
jgi:hypothetical protein